MAIMIFGYAPIAILFIIVGCDVLDVIGIWIVAGVITKFIMSSKETK